MKKAWKTILIVALCILIVGEIVLGVGLATGGSPDRIWEAAYEHYDIGSIFAFIKSSGIIWPLFCTGLFYLAFSGLLTLLLGWVEKKLDYFKV